MPRYFCISIHFLSNTFHGRGDQGLPEWPPSPFRLIQALVAGTARMEKGRTDKALSWLTQQEPPMIISPPFAPIQAKGYTAYVLNNQTDKAARSWVKGRDKNLSDFRSAKYIRPILLDNDGDCPGLHYLWELPEEVSIPSYKELVEGVHAVTQFGWGIDLVVAHATILSENQAKQLPGERWLPTDLSGGNMLRIPVKGSLEDIYSHYEAFLQRISLDSKVFKPVPPLSQFAVATYRRENDISIPPYAVFALRRPDDKAFAAFSSTRQGLHLMGMMRHTASQPDFAASLGWDMSHVASFVLGHGEPKGQGKQHRPVQGNRLVFIPLPSMEYRGAAKGRSVGAIRRVLVTVRGSISNEVFNHIISYLEGRELIDEKTGQSVAFLRYQSSNDRAVQPYFAEASQWTSVTPVILPGYDDPGKLRRRLDSGQLNKEEKNRIFLKLEKRIDYLLRKALRQAGYPEEWSQNAHLKFRGAGFLPGVDFSREYAVSNQHRRFRRLHVLICWRNQKKEPMRVSGPIYIGGGRFTGLGLFAPVMDHLP